eukprot:1067563-Prorocentrum_minimum.AAC.1
MQLGRDTDTVELTIKPLLSHLTTGKFNSPTNFHGRRMFVSSPREVGLDTDTVELTVKTLLSPLVTLERIQFSHQFSRTSNVRVEP